MGAPDLIFELRSKGYSIQADGDYLDISPADIPPELVRQLKQSKAEILTELQREKLENLVRLCARHYNFTEAELTQTLALALADPIAAMEAYSSVAKKIPVSVQQSKAPMCMEQYKGAECGNCQHLSMTKASPAPDHRRIFQWTCKTGFKPLAVGYGLERLLVAPEECDCYAGAKVH